MNVLASDYVNRFNPFSDSHSRVFTWLFGQPERSFHLSELRWLTGLGSASLQRELNRLTNAGLLDSERIGNLWRFLANRNSPVFSELVSLTRKTLGVVPMLRDALMHLTPKLQLAFIYGSVAKQSDTASSDVDVMLVGNDLFLGDVLEQLMPLEALLGRKINPNCYSPVEFELRRAEPGSFVNRVLLQPVLMLFGNIDEPVSVR